MRSIALVLVLLPLPLVAQERSALSCAPDGGESFHVTLWNPSEFGIPLHCVDAPELEGLVDCAPDGGWGLTDPARPEAPLRIATRSTEIVDHVGGKLFARVRPSEFVASASVGRGPPLALEVSGETFWRIRVALDTGRGVVETRDGQTAITCERL